MVRRLLLATRREPIRKAIILAVKRVPRAMRRRFGDDAAGVLRNDAASDLVLTVTFVAPQGSPFRIDEANPGCSVS